MNEVTNEAGVANGTMDSATLPPRLREIAERETAIRKTRMSAPGTLGLPKLLDARRLEYGITDGAFKRAAVFDRVLIYQIPMQSGDKFEEGSMIHMPESTKQVERNRAPHGIVISAGLLALDQLRSNGIDLGHRVMFAHTAPYHVRFDTVLGQHMHLIVLTAGDIFASEDFASDLAARRVRIIQNAAVTDRVEHVLINENGKPVLPIAARAEDS